jgi:hypothetical protein
MPPPSESADFAFREHLPYNKNGPIFHAKELIGMKLTFVDDRHAEAFRELRAQLHDPTNEYWLGMLYIAASSEALLAKMSPYIKFDERSFYGHDMLDKTEFTKEETVLATLSVHLFNNTKKFDLSLMSQLPRELVPVALSAIALRYQVAEI